MEVQAERLDAAAAVYAETLTLAGAVSDTAGIAQVCHVWGLLQIERGDDVGARELLQRAIEVGKTFGPDRRGARGMSPSREGRSPSG